MSSLRLWLAFSISILAHSLQSSPINKVDVCHPQQPGSIRLGCEEECDSDKCRRKVTSSHYTTSDCSGSPDGTGIDSAAYARHQHNCNNNHFFNTQSLRRVLASSSSSTNCSALRANVIVTTEKTTITANVSSSESSFSILLSSQALFAPFTYSLESTPIVDLLSDICDPQTQISTDLSNKVVILYESIGSCSAHSKISRAQTLGALAVLLSNNDYSAMVSNIVDDDSINASTTIPARGISKKDADEIRDYIATSYNVNISISCDDSKNYSYPSVLCMTATHKHENITHLINGEFEIQSGKLSHNGHPVWRMEEYSYWTEAYYMYLHDAQGDKDWFWALSTDENMVDDNDIYLRCNATNITVADPTLCPLWMTIDGSHAPRTTSFTGDVCPQLHSLFQSVVCVQSASLLEGIRGTYNLIISKSGATSSQEWTRLLSDCDQRSAVLDYVAASGSFKLFVGERGYEPKAICTFNESMKVSNSWQHLAFRPDLCHEWKVKSATHYNYNMDASFAITIGECASGASCAVSEAPDVLCVSNNSALMGEYVKLNTVGTYYNTAIYKRSVAADNNSSMYIWYSNEFYAHTAEDEDDVHSLHYTRYWVLSPNSLESTIASDDHFITHYASCFGYASGNPLNCANWMLDIMWKESLVVNEGACDANMFPSVPNSWPQYICAKSSSSSLASSGLSPIPSSLIVGGYQLYDNLTFSFPVWRKAHNDATNDSALYLWYDTALLHTFGPVWEISSNYSSHSRSHHGQLLYCDPYHRSSDSQTLNPANCARWFDIKHAHLDNLDFYECSADDMTTTTTTTSATQQVTADICLVRSSSSDTQTHAFVEGVYGAMMHLVSDYNTVEFLKEDDNDVFYIWYHDSKWMLTDIDYASAMQEYASLDDVAVYGYCAGGESDAFVPICTGCWQFYWELSSSSSVASIEDCSFVLTTDVTICEQDVEYLDLVQYAQYLCVTGSSFYSGAYQQYSGFYESIEEYEGLSLLLELNTISNHWLFWKFGEEIGSNNFYCDNEMLQSGVVVPVSCVSVAVDDSDDNNDIDDVFVVANANECPSANNNNKNNKSKNEGGKVAAIVVAIIIGIICIVAIAVFLWMKKGDYSRQKDIEQTEMIEKNTSHDQDVRKSVSSPQKLATFDDDLCAPDQDDDEDQDDEDHDDEQTEAPLNEP